MASLQSSLRRAGSVALDREEKQVQVTPRTVVPEGYADFFITIYKDRGRHDVGKIFVMNFEWALDAWICNPSPVCIHAEQCGRSVVVVHNGDVYACDHGIHPEYKLVNVCIEGFVKMVDKSVQSGFSITKKTLLANVLP